MLWSRSAEERLFGAEKREMRGARKNHIEDLAENGIRAHVQEPRSHIAIPHAGFEPLLRAAIADIPAEKRVLGRKQDRRNTTVPAIERAALQNVPQIEPARAPATWLTGRMTDPNPLPALLRAAALKSVRTFSEMHPHLGPWLEHENLTQVETSTTGLSRGENGRAPSG